MTAKKAGDHAINRESLYGTTSEPTYAGVTSFMRRKYTQDLAGVDLVVSGVPLDTATTNRPGTRLGPRGIRAASSMIAWERPYGTEVDPFDKLAVIDYGDCFFDFGRPETVPGAIEEHAVQPLEDEQDFDHDSLRTMSRRGRRDLAIAARGLRRPCRPRGRCGRSGLCDRASRTGWRSPCA